MRTFLLRLNDKGYVKIYIDTDTKQQVYLASKTKKEYLQNTAQSFVSKFFDNSLGNFISAFSGGNRLDQESAEQLKKFLNEED